MQDGLVQVVTDEDYLNMHIRPWASQRSIAAQVADLNAGKPDWSKIATATPDPAYIRRA